MLEEVEARIAYRVELAPNLAAAQQELAWAAVSDLRDERARLRKELAAAKARATELKASFEEAQAQQKAADEAGAKKAADRAAEETKRAAAAADKVKEEARVAELTGKVADFQQRVADENTP